MNSDPWFKLPATGANNSKKALVIGAGLAGCSTARALAERGWEIIVLEQGPDLASGASGNRAALLRPHASRSSSTAEQFFADAYATSLQLFKKLLAESEHTPNKFFLNLTGALQLTDNPRDYSESKHLKIVSRESASKLCGIDLPTGGLYYPNAGSVDIKSACKALLHHPSITLRCEFIARQLLKEEDTWHVSDNTRTFSAPILVLANGATLGNFEFTRELTVTATRGQTTLVSPGLRKTPEIPVCGKHYLIPQHHPDSPAPHWQIGASFDRTSDQAVVTAADDDNNLNGIDALLGNRREGSRQPRLSAHTKIIDNWAGVRSTTPDRLPIVGALPHADFYRTRYADIHHGRAASGYPDAEYHPGLYVNGGYGSRGLCVSALCAELLAAQITGKSAAEKLSDSNSGSSHDSDESVDTTNAEKRDRYLQLLHPARFHIRRLKKSGTLKQVHASCHKPR